MNKILLDTNAMTAFFRGDEAVHTVLKQAATVYMSAVVLAELYTGLKGDRQEKEKREMIRSFIRKPVVFVLPATAETAEIVADLKQRLRIHGTPIPLHDVWVAAHAIETGSVLVTYDRHFAHIEGLRVWEGV